MMKNLQFHIVDAFIRPETQFTGNPAVVIVLPSDVCFRNVFFSIIYLNFIF